MYGMGEGTAPLSGVEGILGRSARHGGLLRVEKEQRPCGVRTTRILAKYMNLFGPAPVSVREQAGRIDTWACPVFLTHQAGISDQAPVELSGAAPWSVRRAKKLRNKRLLLYPRYLLLQPVAPLEEGLSLVEPVPGGRGNVFPFLESGGQAGQ